MILGEGHVTPCRDVGEWWNCSIRYEWQCLVFKFSIRDGPPSHPAIVISPIVGVNHLFQLVGQKFIASLHYLMCFPLLAFRALCFLYASSDVWSLHVAPIYSWLDFAHGVLLRATSGS